MFDLKTQLPPVARSNDTPTPLNHRSCTLSRLLSLWPHHFLGDRHRKETLGTSGCCLIYSSIKIDQRSSATQTAARCSACRGTLSKEGRMGKGLWHRYLQLRGGADAPARRSTISLSVAALPAPCPAAHSSACATRLIDASVLSGLLAPVRIVVSTVRFVSV